MKKISLIGCTGSIGSQVIKVCLAHPDRFKIISLCAGKDSPAFRREVERLKPEYWGVDDEALAALPEADVVFNAASGFAGLKYTLAAINAGKDVALANKESLVAGADIVLPAAKRAGANLIPVDSEHSAIWQCLNFGAARGVNRLIITASGGAFRGKKFCDLKDVTPAQALNHPTWQMGAKITVDSAILLNKGYEVMEAHALFGVPYSDIVTVIQPTSVVHSLVEFKDGAVMAQMGVPSMEIPIQLALSYPERLPSSSGSLNFASPLNLSFEPMKREDYPMFDLALYCAERGGASPCALNAADEVAVLAFLSGKIAFTAIYDVTKESVEKTGSFNCTSFDDLKEVDSAARAYARECVNKHIY